MSVKQEPRWRRLPSAERRDQLLDAARTLILEHGLNSFTMEALTKEAGVSKPLAYKYFKTRLELLQSLLYREYTAHYDRLERELAQAKNYSEVAMIVVESDFNRQSGQDIIKMLRGQSDVDKVLDPLMKTSGNRLGELLVAAFLEEFDVDLDRAKRIVRMASGTSRAAAERYKEHGGDRDRQIRETVQFIFGGIRTFLT